MVEIKVEWGVEIWKDQRAIKSGIMRETSVHPGSNLVITTEAEYSNIQRLPPKCLSGKVKVKKNTSENFQRMTFINLCMKGCWFDVKRYVWRFLGWLLKKNEVVFEIQPKVR